MSECRRSKRIQQDKHKNGNSDYGCACSGENAYGIAGECELCQYLCCKDCIHKRFDIISSERKYKNIIKNAILLSGGK